MYQRGAANHKTQVSHIRRKVYTWNFASLLTLPNLEKLKPAGVPKLRQSIIVTNLINLFTVIIISALLACRLWELAWWSGRYFLFAWKSSRLWVACHRKLWISFREGGVFICFKEMRIKVWGWENEILKKKIN